jgi:hypothetical protein
LIPYTITDDGRLKTRFPRLLEQISEAGIFPPPADDTERCFIRTGLHHIGSQMQTCWCRDCKGVRLWPVGYIVDKWISYTCLLNRAKMVEDGPMPERLTMSDLAERVVYDPHAWRTDGIGKLWTREEIPPREVVAALRKFKWSMVTGAGKHVRIEKRGLSSVGALADFVYLGRDLKAVVGAGADDVVTRLNAYSREPRRAGVRVIWQRTTERRAVHH